MKTAIALLLGLVLVMSFCTPQNEASEDQEDIVVGKGPVVVSFKNPHDIETKFHFYSAAQNDSTWIGKMPLATLFYDNTQAALNNFSDKPDLIFDTLSVSPADDFQIFRHLVNYFDVNDYLLQKGDSVQIEYRNKWPQVTILNRKILKYDSGLDSLTRSYFKQGHYSPLGKYLDARAFALSTYMSTKKAINENNTLAYSKKSERNLRFVADFRNKIYPDAKAYLRTENGLLDSLKAIKELSPVPYHFYKERNKYLGHLLDVQTDRLARPQIIAILRAHQVNRFGYPDIYYQQFVEAVGEKYVEEKTDYVDPTKPSPRDYKQVFDQIDTSSLFPEKDRNYLLTQEIKRIHDTFSHDDFITYFKKYEARVKDTSLVNSVREDFALEFDDRRSETASVVLTDLKGKELTLDDVKARHKGKVLYMDFWASWCGPCREAMPASAELRKVLKGKDVVFVYLSIDGSIKPWQRASTAENLAKYDDNYLIVNSKTSDFLKQNKLIEIPRYMIFDKTGRLTHANAPRVESGEVGLLLTTLADKP